MEWDQQERTQRGTPEIRRGTLDEGDGGGENPGPEKSGPYARMDWVVCVGCVVRMIPGKGSPLSVFSF